MRFVQTLELRQEYFFCRVLKQTTAKLMKTTQRELGESQNGKFFSLSEKRFVCCSAGATELLNPFSRECDSCDSGGTL